MPLYYCQSDLAISCVELAEQAVEQGIDPLKVIQEGCSGRMQIVGEKFSTQEPTQEYVELYGRVQDKLSGFGLDYSLL